MAGVDVLRFWQLTPAELCIEIEAWNQRQQIEDYRAGLLCAVIAEPNRDSKKHKQPFTPQDFMPLGNNEAKQTTHIKDWREQLSVVEKLNQILGGEDLRR